MLEYKYNEKEALSRLVTAFQYLTREIPQPLFIASIKLITEQLGVIYTQLGNPQDFKNLIAEILKKDISLLQLNNLIEKLVKEEKATLSNLRTQTELLSKFSLLTSTKKQQITSAVETLYYVYSNNHDQVKSRLQSPLSAVEEDQQDFMLNQLMSNVSKILKTHIDIIIVEINKKVLEQNGTLPTPFG